MSTEHILVQDADGVRTITLNRPDKRNALTVAMYDAMASAIADANTEHAVRAILIQGSGGFFTGGNDIQDFVANPPLAEDSAVFRFLFAIAGCAVPVVAAVEGMAVGVGTTLLLHCDLVYAAPDARFHVPFVDLGLVPEAASSLLMPATMGHAKAAAMLMLGEPIDAAEAEKAGLLTAIVPAGELKTVAAAKARALAAKPATAMRHTKALMRPDREQVLSTMRAEGRIFGEMLRSPEAQAAFRAFLSRGR